MLGTKSEGGRTQAFQEGWTDHVRPTIVRIDVLQKLRSFDSQIISRSLKEEVWTYNAADR
jgi:hypothetical protein